MRVYRADLHIHSVLSPCGDLEMSPRNIVAMAKARNLDIIAITDHNSTIHGPLVRELASPLGIFTLFGAEVTTREEVHCLCLFETEEQRTQFQDFIYSNLPKINNDTSRFGIQVQVNHQDEIIYEEPLLLISAIKAGINDVERKTHELLGIFIPAHIDRPMFSLTSQLGFVPSDLNYDALELSRFTTPEVFMHKNSYLNGKPFVKNSDAHFINHIGENITNFRLNELSFDEIKFALRSEKGRCIIL